MGVFGMKVLQSAVDQCFRGTLGSVRERHCVLDLPVVALDWCQDQNANHLQCSRSARSSHA